MNKEKGENKTQHLRIALNQLNNSQKCVINIFISSESSIANDLNDIQCVKVAQVMIETK